MAENLLPVPIGPNGAMLYLTEDMVKSRSLQKQQATTEFFQNFGKRGTAMSTGFSSTASSISGAIDKPRDTPNFGFLRQMRKQSMIDQVIISIRLAQVRHVARRSSNPKRELGWRVRHKYANDPRFENTPQIDARCLQAEAMIEQGLNRTWHPTGLRGVLISMIEDELTIDRRVIVYDGLDSKDRPVGWHVVDPTTVKPRIDLLIPAMDQLAGSNNQTVPQMMAQPDAANRVVARASMANNINLADKAYIQEVDGAVVGAWADNEICVDMIYVSTELNRWGYGCSPLEQSLWWSLAFVLAAQYNSDLFKQTYPEAVMFLFGDYEPEGLEAFKKQVLGETAIGTNWRLPIIPGGDNMKAEITKLRDTPRDMLFSQWLKMLTSYKAACYRMNPELLNFDLVRASDATIFQRGNNVERVSLSQEEGFHSILYGLGDYLTRALIAPWFDDLVFEWVGTDAMSETEEAGLRGQEMMYSTLDEVRAKTGELAPLQGDMAQYGGMILNPTLIQMIMGQQQMEMQQAMAMAQAKAAPPQKRPAAKKSMVDFATQRSLTENIDLIKAMQYGDVKSVIDMLRPKPGETVGGPV